MHRCSPAIWLPQKQKDHREHGIYSFLYLSIKAAQKRQCFKRRHRLRDYRPPLRIRLVRRSHWAPRPMHPSPIPSWLLPILHCANDRTIETLHLRTVFRQLSRLLHLLECNTIKSLIPGAVISMRHNIARWCCDAGASDEGCLQINLGSWHKPNRVLVLCSHKTFNFPIGRRSRVRPGRTGGFTI